MPKTYDEQYFLEELSVPDYLLVRAMATPRLLPGERPEDYYMLLEAMVLELVPDLDLEWFVTIDLAWLFFDIERYRRWKNALIAIHQRAALTDALVKTDPAYVLTPPSILARVEIATKVNAIQGDHAKDDDVSAQLASHGYDDDAVNAFAFLRGIESLATIDRFLSSARHQLTTILKEAIARREFKVRAELMRKRFVAEESKPVAIGQGNLAAE